MNSRTFDIALADIKRAQEGDRESLSKLLRRVSDLMFVYVYWLTLDHHLAWDLAQDATLHVLRYLKGLKIDKLSTFWVWTYRAALDMVLDRRRLQDREQVTPPYDIDADDSTPLEAAGHQSGQEATAAMLGGITALKFEYRHVLVLRCLGKMHYHEMAQILGIANLEARWLCFRAKRSLKQHLANRQFERRHLATALNLFISTTT